MIDRSKPVPLYYQVEQTLREKILKSELPQGTQLPPEPELARQFGVSSITIKHALRNLAAQGLVVRRQGKGTFVLRTWLSCNTLALTSFTEDATRHGVKTSTQVLRSEVIPAAGDMAGLFALKEGGEVLTLELLRSVNDVPSVLQWTYLPLCLFPGLDRIDLRDRALYSVMEKEFGLRPERAEQTVEATSVGSKEARLLRLSRGAAVMRIQRLSYLADGRCVELSHALCRAELYRFRMELARDPAAAWPVEQGVPAQMRSGGGIAVAQPTRILF